MRRQARLVSLAAAGTALVTPACSPGRRRPAGTICGARCGARPALRRGCG